MRIGNRRLRVEAAGTVGDGQQDGCPGCARAPRKAATKLATTKTVAAAAAAMKMKSESSNPLFRRCSRRPRLTNSFGTETYGLYK